MIRPTIIARKISKQETDLLIKSYHLRYKVYCEDRKFIRKELFSTELENDAYDSQSVHFAALTPSGEPMATLRMILPGPYPLPVEHALKKRFSDSIRDYAELSRLIFCRPDTAGETKHPGHNTGTLAMTRAEKSLTINETLVHIFAVMYKESLQLGITHWFALMEPTLHRLLKYYGFPFECIGSSVEFYGEVSPYMGTVKELAPRLFDLLEHEPWERTESVPAILSL